jgi:carboxyl-terminal processing protease
MIRVLILAIVGAVSFYIGKPGTDPTDPEKEKVIQRTVMSVLEQVHFDPLKLDDEMSKEIYTSFIEYLDGSKRYYTQEDLNQLAVYKTQLDDQINASSLEFFDKATELFQARIDGVDEIFREILAEPIDYSKSEEIELDADKREFPKTTADLKDHWRKLLKYEVIEAMESRIKKQDAAASDKKDTPVEKKSLSEIEIEARAAVLKTFEEWYKNYAKLRRSDRFELYLNAIAHLYDPHTDYYNPKEKQDFDINMGGKLEGIGARLRADGDLTKIVSIVPGGPVWKNKEIEVDDVILKVKQPNEEAVDIFGMRTDDVVQFIRGPKGTHVFLTIKKKDGTIKEIDLERDVINIEESFAKSAIIDLEGVIDNVGYIDLPKFYSSFEGPDGNSCAVDVAKEIEKLKRANVNGIILDLRNNGGGSLRDVVDMSGLFIEDGPIVQVKPRDRSPYVYKDEDINVQYTGPLIVLVNAFSASASEILAAALQDYDRALIVGTQSFGKGTVQRFVPLDRAIRGNDQFKPLGEVKVTMQKFYRINGGSTQLKGVSPDINLPDRYSYIDVGEREYPHAMPWSEIQKLEYSQDVYKIDNKELLKQKSDARRSNSEQFALIDKQAKWFKKNRETTKLKLSLSDYQAQIKKQEEEVKDFDGILKNEIEDLKVKNLKEDATAINFDETTKASNDSWLTNLKKDIYLEESLSILADMIHGKDITKIDKSNN